MGLFPRASNAFRSSYLWQFSILSLCLSVDVRYRESGLNVPSKHFPLPGPTVRWKPDMTLGIVWFQKAFVATLHYDSLSRKYKANLLYFLSSQQEQRDSNLSCDTIVMITCDIFAKSGKNIYIDIYICCKYQSLKTQMFLIVCHHYNGKYCI